MTTHEDSSVLVSEWDAPGIVHHTALILGPASTGTYSVICSCGFQQGAYLSRDVPERVLRRHHKDTTKNGSSR